MPYDLQSTLELLMLSDYTCLAVVTALVYDFVLTFSREVEYVWCRPWTRVSTLFICIRYFGLYWSIIYALVGTTFLSGTLNVDIGMKLEHFKGTVVFISASWSLPVSLGAIDIVMILRVYAMWNRSRTILYSLLFLFVIQIIVGIISCAFYDNPNTTLSVTIARVLDFAFCDYTFEKKSFLVWCSLSIQIVLGGLVLILALAKTGMDSVEMYRATKEWQPNQYMKLLARDGLVYFIANMLRIVSVVNAVVNGSASTHTAALLMENFSYLTVCPVMPRFMIAVWELYEHDMKNRWRGNDAGFGVYSNAQPNATRSIVRFAASSISADVETEFGTEVQEEAEPDTGISHDEVGPSRV